MRVVLLATLFSFSTFASTVSVQNVSFEELVRQAELIVVARPLSVRVDQKPVLIHGSKKQAQVKIPIHTLEIEEVLEDLSKSAVSGKIRVISPSDIVLKQFGNANVVSWVERTYSGSYKKDLKGSKESLIFFLSKVRAEDPDLQGTWAFTVSRAYESKTRLQEVKIEIQKKRESSK